MSSEIFANPTPAAKKHVVQWPWLGAVGLGGVLLMTIATAAPITVMLGNVLITVGGDNGQFVPARFTVVTLIPALFTIGYAQMARFVIVTGAFYGFISYGPGRIVGMASGATVTMAYIVFEAALIGIFALLYEDLINTVFSVHTPWLIFTFAILMATGVLSYFDISFISQVLGLCLVLEILIPTAVVVAVLIYGGGSQGLVPELVSPLNAFAPTKGVVDASVGVGLFFVSQSWAGFEPSAMYGEKSKNPKKITPLATLLDVIGIGVFYVFISWMAIAGMGPKQVITLTRNPNRTGEIFYGPARQYLGEWAVRVFRLLVITGSFTYGMAFHNCAARYLYMLGRENLLPFAGRMLGRSHSRHGSPHAASTIQTVIVTLIVLLLSTTGKDPYADIYTLLVLLGAVGIVIVQAPYVFAMIVCFYDNKEDIDKRHWFKIGVAPLFGGMEMTYTVYLLFKNVAFVVGVAVNSSSHHAIPWIVLVCFCFGAVIVVWFYLFDAQKYRVIGRIVLTDD